MRLVPASIRSRLALTIALLLGLLIVVSVIAIARFQSLSRITQEIVENRVHRVVVSDRANQEAQQAAHHLLRLFITPDREDRVPIYAAMDEALAISDRAIGSLSDSMAGEPPDIQLGGIVQARRAYGESFQQTVEFIEFGELDRARQHFETSTDVALQALLGAVRQLVADQQASMQNEVAALTAAASGAKARIVVISALAVLLGALLAGLMARAIVRPIHETQRIARSIAGGDYSQPIPTTGRGEMGTLLGALATMRDSVAERESRIWHLAYMDSLTGLRNRAGFFDRFAALPAGTHGALILLDINRFAAINQALGHAVGDRLLCETATRIEYTLDDQDIAARLWADEFALVVCGADREAASRHAERILDSLRAPMSVDGQRLDIDASLGIALFPDNGSDPSQLLRHADAALGVAKRRHDGHAFIEHLETAQSHRELSLVGEMRDALRKHEFAVVYQPKLDLRSHRITGAEALLRWHHPQKGLIAPDRFIPFAEQTGFIREITPWLIERVICDVVQWRRDGLDVVAAINLSAQDLASRTLVATVEDLLVRHGLPAHQLCLEITESALMDDPELSRAHLEKLSALGLNLAIDDYGTGQASLGYVRTLPVTELKLDRIFITDVDSNVKNAAIVRSTILLCRDLGLALVAEGAESRAEIRWLCDSRCDLVQGFGIARPMPVAEFVAWTRNFAGLPM